MMEVKDYKALLELVRKYGIATILRFVADAWGVVWPEKYEIKPLPDNMCTQRCCLKNHNLGIIECDEECHNRTSF